MPWTQIRFQSGIYTDDSPLQAEGHFVASDKIRFVRGQPQTLHGWEQVAGDITLSGVCRGMHAFADNAGDKRIGFGTHSHLQILVDNKLTDITPVQATGILTDDPMETVAGSPAVRITHIGHGRATGDRVHFDGAVPAGGTTITGTFTVATVLDTDHYTINHSESATSSGAGGGATVAFTYFLPAGLEHGTGGRGFGTGAYSVGGYSTPSTEVHYPRTWSLDNWGEHLIGCPRGLGIYEWRNDAAERAIAIAGSPDKVASIMVATDQRILVALGCSDAAGIFDPMLIRWTDAEDNTLWLPSLANLAGDFRLAAGSRIVAGRKGRGEYLIWTDTALYAMRFNGDPGSVYSFILLGTECGLIGPNAAVVKDGIAYWLSRNGQFYRYAGGTPKVLPCTVRRDTFDNLSWVQEDKVYARAVSPFDEIWWHYPDRRDGNENSRYIIYSIAGAVWSNGNIDRTAGIDQSPMTYPVAASSDGEVYFHEKGHSADGGAIDWSLTTAPIDLADGDGLIEIAGMMPDFEDLTGGVLVTFRCRPYPQATDQETVTGPFALTPTTDRLDFLIAGRQAQATFASTSVPSFMRFGTMRFLIEKTGQRQ